MRPRPLCARSPGTARWEAKTQWIEDFAPRTTRTKGVIGEGQEIARWKHNSGLVTGFPTWDWLWKEIEHGEDVELIIQGNIGNVPFAHAVTLTRMGFDDLDGDGMPDPLTERPDIGYIDPNIPTQVSPAGLDPATFALGPLRFNWRHGTVPREVFVRSAMSESPVPEPSVVMLLLSGGSALLVRVRRRCRPRNSSQLTSQLPTTNSQPSPGAVRG